MRGPGPLALFGKSGLGFDQPDEIAEIRVDHPDEQNQQQAEIDADANQKRLTGSEQTHRERQPAMSSVRRDAGGKMPRQ